MNALLDFYPRYCPNCATPTKPLDQYGQADWQAHASHICLACKMIYQYAETDAIWKAAGAVGGDLAR